MNSNLLGVAGIVVIVLIAVLFSSNRKAIRLRVVGAAFALQALIAFLVLRTSGGRQVIQSMSDGVAALLGYAGKGTEFLFGPTASNPLANTFAIAALPVIIFFASLVAILYHSGYAATWSLGRRGDRLGHGLSRVESLGAAANIFVGQSESPLVVRPISPAVAQPFVHPDDGRMAASPGRSSRPTPGCSARNTSRSCSPRPSCRRRAGS